LVSSVVPAVPPGAGGGKSGRKKDVAVSGTSSIVPLPILGCKSIRWAAGDSARNKEGANQTARASPFTSVAYLPQPEQQAQQSVEGQHVAFAAFAAPVKPSAITAINRIARMFFIFVSLEKSNWFLWTDDNAISVNQGNTSTE